MSMKQNKLSLCRRNLKEGVHVLLWDVSLQRRVGVFAHHVIDGSHNLCHFLGDRQSPNCSETWADVQTHSGRARHHLSVDVAISVDVIKVEGPLQLFPHCASQQYGQPCYKVLETMTWKHQILKPPQSQDKYVFTLNLMEPLFAVSKALNR